MPKPKANDPLAMLEDLEKRKAARLARKDTGENLKLEGEFPVQCRLPKPGEPV